ncbi:MAG: hypothetical protein QF718_01155 [Phycisphaerales bacterium]|jgi:hypothetical protein|nr:hypothetical protein [Phycisphaerales bacterium]
MHEKRNFILVLLIAVGVIWCGWAWFYSGDEGFSLMRVISTLLTISIALWITYALTLEDRLPDQLQELIGSHYFEADGVCLFPVIRSSNAGPELSIYYQNRFENPASVIVHLKPTMESFIVVPGATDVHIAFTVGGGDVGIIHQPIKVPSTLRGEIVELKMVAVSHYPRSHGTRWRRNEGRPCGSMNVDWAGNAMRVGVHEVDGTVELSNPVTLHLAMPKSCSEEDEKDRTWRQELL